MCASVRVRACIRACACAHVEYYLTLYVLLYIMCYFMIKKLSFKKKTLNVRVHQNCYTKLF